MPKKKKPAANKAAPKAVNPLWAKRVSALQAQLGLDNEAMATHLGVSLRTYHSWKYGERNPSPAAVRLIDVLTPKK